MPVSRNGNSFCKIHYKLKTNISVQIFAKAGWSKHKDLWAVGLSAPGVQEFCGKLKITRFKKSGPGLPNCFLQQGKRNITAENIL